MACCRCSSVLVISGGVVEADEVVRDSKTASGEICDRFTASEGSLEIGDGHAVKPDVGSKSEGEGQTCDFLSAFTARAFFPDLTRDYTATNESETQSCNLTNAAPVMHPQSDSLAMKRILTSLVLA